MKDNADKRLDQLFASARTERINTVAAEEFFETRLLARIKERREAAVPWYASAWRMVPIFATVAAVITIAAITYNPSRSSDMFAAITSGQDEVVGNSYLAGE